METEHTKQAQRFFRGVFGGDATVVDDLAAPGIVVSYPVFAAILGTPVIRGREAVKAFVGRFSQRWAEPHFEFHETVADAGRVVLVWSFSARNAAPPRPDEPATNERHRWGGITFFRFNPSGEIAAEIGEESAPGPMGRLGDSRGE